MTDNKTYHCAIIDDEPLAIEVIEEHIAQFDNLNVKATFTKAIAAIELLTNEPVDLLFLDINMPGLSGVEFLKSLQNPPAVIFTTAYRNFAVDAFDLNALDYLVKPVSLERFTKAITRFLSQQSQHQQTDKQTKAEDFIVIQSDKKNYKLPFSDIQYIESLDNYVKVYTTEQNLVCYQQLSALHEQLPAQFIRIHRSTIVNKNKVTVFTSSFVQIGDKQFTIGRSYRDDVHRILSL